MQSPADDPLIPIGHITKPHGIRGELLLVFAADDPALLKGDVFLSPSAARPGGQPVAGAPLSASGAASLRGLPSVPSQAMRKVTIERVRMHHGSLIVSFAGVHSRNEAELLRQHTLLAPRSRLSPLEEDEVYLLDLPGLRVLAVDEKSGGEREIGVIASVDIPAGQELWTITTPDGQEILFPAVDQFVLGIDLDARTARIAPPPGLLEIYLQTK